MTADQIKDLAVRLFQRHNLQGWSVDVQPNLGSTGAARINPDTRTITLSVQWSGRPGDVLVTIARMMAAARTYDEDREARFTCRRFSKMRHHSAYTWWFEMILADLLDHLWINDRPDTSPATEMQLPPPVSCVETVLERWLTK